MRWSGALTAVGSALLVSGCANPTDEPDLVLIVIDTLRADRLACYGGPPDLGASICGLGSEGTRFTWAFSTAPLTVPSAASILTSRYPSEHALSQFDEQPLQPALPTLAESLRDAGYATAAFVSNPVLARKRGLDRGFEVYDDRMTRSEPNRPDYLERGAAEATNAALAWLEEAERPFFLWVHYQDPHGPYLPPGIQPEPDAEDARRLPLLADNSGFQGIPAYQKLETVSSPAAYERLYLEEIRHTDTHVGRLLEALRQRSPEAGVLVTADHGEALGEDGYFFSHGHSVSLDQIRVPLVWRPPGPGREPTSSSEAVSTLDVAPTLLRAAGLSAPPAFRGEALRDGEPQGGRQRVFYSEHVARLAVVARGFYFARDLGPLGSHPLDPNSGGVLRPLPSRMARLDPSGASASYAPAGAERAQGFEAAVHDFLARRPAAGRPAPLTPDARRRLRALGYIE